MGLLLLLAVLWDSDSGIMSMLGGVFMKHKVRALVQVEKYGTITVDGATYRKMKRAERDRPFSIGEMMFYDLLWNDED